MFSTAVTRTDDDVVFSVKAFSFTSSGAKSTQCVAQRHRQFTIIGDNAGRGQAVRYGIVRKDDRLLVPIQ